MVKRVLVATDFSLAADAAWQFAVEFAASSGAHLVVLHVTDVSTPAASAPPAPQPHADADRLLGERLARAKARGLSATGVKHTGDPADVIIATARAQQADTVILGTRFDTAGERVRQDRVARRVVRALPCAVIVVAPDVPAALAS